jgi:hypothetical protein
MNDKFGSIDYFELLYIPSAVYLERSAANISFLERQTSMKLVTNDAGIGDEQSDSIIALKYYIFGKAEMVKYVA